MTSFVILDLKDGRRIFGWPSVWPSDPSKGHIVLQNPEWISENGEYIANSTSKCDTRLCRLTVLFEYLDRLPESETFPRS
ncbi:hypothetical protein [Aeromonas sp. ASNIH3]|uniref:hypothetical protein n=1 Tax=Aeromonas sp. ASNIH3 TaxID=1636608 RepID=UPI003FA3D117